MSKKRREKKMIARIKAHGTRRRRKQQTPEIPIMPPMFEMPSFADIEAPEGFRPITGTQALMEFAAPLHDYMSSGDIDAMNTLMQLATTVWNFTLPKVLDKPPKEEIVEEFAETLDIDERDAAHLVDELIERKQYLFPEDIQPEDYRIMFMRKEVEYLIAQFDEARLGLSDKPIPADSDDQKMLKALKKLDKQLKDGEEYDEWEELCFQVEDMCCAGYFRWLTAKGAPEQQCQEFPYSIETFLDFVYRYNGISVLDISDFDLEEFLMDHLPRKVMVQPNEYVNWPPAMRLFYTFLAEKGYCRNPDRICNLISSIETEFVDMLKKQF